MPQAAAGVFVTPLTSLLEVSFMLADGNVYAYDTLPQDNVVVDNSVFRVTSVIGFFVGNTWGGVWWNQIGASQVVFKHL